MTPDVAVVGLGYVGLSLAQGACSAGMRVAGYDISPTVVTALASGRSHVLDISDEMVRAMLAAGFTPTADPAVMARADTVVICVPTPLDGQGAPDLVPLRSAAQTVGRYVRAGMLVSVESTSFPGTTDEVVRPILERESGLVAGDDFHLAYSPERIDPGNKRYGLESTPKIVGGHTEACADAATRFYKSFVGPIVRARGTREAELAKVIENTYRSVNIALVNEIAQLSHDTGIDVWDAIDCAATKPFGFEPFYPGPGPGGHCIPVDPVFFATWARMNGATLHLTELAQQINGAMPAYVVDRAGRLLNLRRKAVNGSAVLLLGVTYKPDTDDVRGSTAVNVARRLLRLGAAVSYHDPHVAGWTVDGTPIASCHDLDAAVRDADLTIVLQNHSEYHPDRLVSQARLLLDTRGHTRRFIGNDVDTVEIL